jgi:hypothetical protein
MEDKIQLAEKYTRIDKDTIVHNNKYYGVPLNPTDEYSTRRLIVDIAITKVDGNFSSGSTLDKVTHTDASLGTAVIQKFFKFLENPHTEDFEFLSADDFDSSGFKYKLLGVAEKELVSEIKDIPMQQVAIKEPEVIIADDLRSTANLITNKAVNLYEDTQPENMKKIQTKRKSK